MTHLELVAEIGSGPMEIVKLYLKGLLSFAELENILGRDRPVWSIPLRLTAERGKSVNYCCRD